MLNITMMMMVAFKIRQLIYVTQKIIGFYKVQKIWKIKVLMLLVNWRWHLTIMERSSWKRLPLHSSEISIQLNGSFSHVQVPSLDMIRKQKRRMKPLKPSSSSKEMDLRKTNVLLSLQFFTGVHIKIMTLLKKIINS